MHNTGYIEVALYVNILYMQRHMYLCHIMKKRKKEIYLFGAVDMQCYDYILVIPTFFIWDE